MLCGGRNLEGLGQALESCGKTLKHLNLKYDSMSERNAIYRGKMDLSNFTALEEIITAALLASGDRPHDWAIPSSVRLIRDPSFGGFANGFTESDCKVLRKISALNQLPLHYKEIAPGLKDVVICLEPGLPNHVKELISTCARLFWNEGLELTVQGFDT